MRRSAVLLTSVVAMILPLTAAPTNASIELTDPLRAETPFIAASGPDAAGFRLPPDVRLTRRFVLSRYGLISERFQQRIGPADAAVLGAELTVYSDVSGATRIVIGTHYDDIAPVNAVRLDRTAAILIARRLLGRDGASSAELVIDPATRRHLWRVETSSHTERWIQDLDAETGKQISRRDAIESDCAGVAPPCGFGVMYEGGNASDIKDLTGLTTRVTTPLGGAYWTLASAPDQNGYRRHRAFDMRNQGDTNKAILALDPDNSWTLLKKSSPGQPALVDAQYYASITDLYYRERHGFDWVAVGDADSGVGSMDVYAHLGVGYFNAYWNGHAAVFGDGDSTSRELTVLDGVAHELTHGTTDFTSNLVYDSGPGALNEAFSDIMGTSVEQWAVANGLDRGGPADWQIGERAMLVPPYMLRSMSDPESASDFLHNADFAADYPDHYTERFAGSSDHHGVHINSSIPNHAYYLLVNGGMNASCASPANHHSRHCEDSEDTQDNNLAVRGIGIDAAEQNFFLAFAALPSTSGMCQARFATEAVAAQLFGGPSSTQRSSTADAWIAVGLTDKECGRSMHIGDLDGVVFVTRSGHVARVTATVHDNLEVGVAGATVRFRWSNRSGSGFLSCITGENGTCLISRTIGFDTTFTVRSVSRSASLYVPSANHDPDGDSNGTSIRMRYSPPS